MTKRLLLPFVITFAFIAAACGGSASPGPTTAPGGAEPTEIGSPVVDGAPLPSAPDAGEDPAAGTPVPQVTSETFDGTEVELLSEGRPAVVLVAAHWCPHCQADVAALREFFDGGGELADGVELVVLHTWPAAERGNWPPSSWLEGLGDRVLLDDAPGSAAAALGLTGTPMWVAVDADGNVVERVVGVLDPAQLVEWSESLAAA